MATALWACPMVGNDSTSDLVTGVADIDGGGPVGGPETSGDDVQPGVDASEAPVDATRECGPDEPSHYDCFGGYYTCVGGVVRHYLGEGIDCEDWTGDCPWIEEYRCASGCAEHATWADEPGVAFHCAGHPHSAPGDRCFSDEGCLPRPTDIDADGTIVVDYLRCDIRTEECYVADPPPVDDFGASCDTRVDGTGDGAVRVARSLACMHRVCVDRWDSENECLLAGCSWRCKHDRDCPQDARCEYEVEEHYEGVPGLSRGVCLPWNPEPVPEEWPCVAPPTP